MEPEQTRVVVVSPGALDSHYKRLAADAKRRARRVGSHPVSVSQSLGAIAA
jgi:hypothetical protein